MHQAEHQRHSRLLRLGFLAALGAGIVYLFRSKRGKEIRENIADKYHSMKEKL